MPDTAVPAHIVEPLADEKQLAFELRLPEDTIDMHSDPGKIRQILVNLLGNAVKFTEAGTVALELNFERRCAVFEVRDTGVGIPDEYQDKIFEPFWQVDSSRTRSAGGTGLGLSVTRRLAELLGGDIALESAVGRGTTFRVRLPARSPGAPHAPA